MRHQDDIPDFDLCGNLPEGVYSVRLQQLAVRFAWNSRRKNLVKGLLKAIENLKAAGVEFLYIDGSFTTAKDEPNDIDGCWVPNLNINENILDDVFIERNPPRKRMKEKYGVDFLIAGLDLGSRGKPIEEFFKQIEMARKKVFFY